MPSVTKTSAPITPVTVAQSYRFVVGVDTHAATHSYAILDSTGALLDEQTFPTTAAGIGRARDWIARRTDEGKTNRDIRRCLKRYTTRQIYRTLNAAHPLEELTPAA